MAELAAISALITAAGAGLSVAGGVQNASAQKSAAQYQYDQSIAQGKQDVAAGQRDALEQDRNTQYTLSREQALAAASGAGVDTPSVLSIYGDTAGRGQYLADSAGYGGKQRAWAADNQAAAAKVAGENAADGSILQGVTNGVNGLSKIDYGKLKNINWG